jgi:hypothetical protein
VDEGYTQESDKVLMNGINTLSEKEWTGNGFVTDTNPMLRDKIGFNIDERVYYDAWTVISHCRMWSAVEVYASYV